LIDVNVSKLVDLCKRDFRAASRAGYGLESSRSQVKPNEQCKKWLNQAGRR